MSISASRLRCVVAFVVALSVATASAHQPRTRAPGFNRRAEPQPLSETLGKYELLNYDPTTDPAAIVVVNGAGNSQVRFSVLTSRIIRVETSTTGSFQDKTTVAIVNRKLAVPEFSSKTSGGVLTIATKDLALTYTVGTAFSGNTLSITPVSTSAFKGWSYGQLDTGNLFGTIKSLDNSAILPLNCTDLVNVYKNGESLHCEWAVMSRDGWAIVNDTTNYALDSQYWWDGPNTDHEDFYFFGHGHDYFGALSEFVQIAGRVPLVPRYSLGTWWSRWYDINNIDTAGIVNAYSSRSLPLDVFIYDMDWHTKYYWGGYTFDFRIFPEYADTLAYLKSRKLRVGANLHDADGVRKTDAMHDALARYMGLDPSTCGDIPFSVVNATYVYGVDDVVLAPLEQAGMDFWWLDYQQGGTQGGATGQKQNPTVWTDRIRVTDTLRRGQNVRGMVLARWGGLGNHRYQVGFSGDVSYLGWDTLAYQPYFTLTASNVAYGFWSHDLVGDNNHELHTRWLQWGAYSPIFRTHDRGMAAGSCADNNPPNCAIVEVWRVPTKNFEINRAAMQARSALIPYLYTAARQAYDYGVSLIRPMYYYYPEEPMAYAANNTSFGQYMFGDDMLVSPVVVPMDSTSQMATSSIWLPPGSNWFEKDTGIVYTGNQVITKTFDLSEIPVYIRSGAVIPSVPVVEGQTIAQAQNQYQELVFSVYLETSTAQQGSAEVYEDNGYTYDYITSQASATTTFSYSLPSPTQIDMTIASTGSYPEFPASRTYTIRLVNQFPPTAVQVNGVSYNYSRFPSNTDAGTWTYEGCEATVVIRILGVSTSSPLQVTVTLPQADNSPLFSVKGYINHARLSKLNLDEAWNSPGSQDMNSHFFLGLASTGPQLSYLAGTNATQFSSVVSNLAANFESALTELQHLSVSAPQVNSNRLAYSIALMKAML